MTSLSVGVHVGRAWYACRNSGTICVKYCVILVGLMRHLRPTVFIGSDPNCNCKTEAEIGKNACAFIPVPSGVIYFVALVSLILCLLLLRHRLICSLRLFFFHVPVILTTSRYHENKPKNPAVQKGGQGLVVFRVLPSPYGSGIFPIPRLKGYPFLT